MSSPEGQSKRERQKARRQEKLAQQAVVSQKERRNRMLAYLAVGLVLLGLVGYSVQNRISANRAAAAKRAEVVAQLDEFGCTPDEAQENAGAGHLDAATLAEQPPETLYPDRPASSGMHFVNTVRTGVYDEVVDERPLVHNLEHGYVVGYYDEGADEAQLEEFKSYGQAQIDGKFPKIILAKWDGELEGDANFAFAAWGRRQMCEEYDEQTFSVFLESHHSSAGDAPERTVPPALAEGSGLDPGDEPLLLPPLGAGGSPSGAPTEVHSDGPSEHVDE